MSELLLKMQMDMELRGFSPKTVTVYLKGVRKLSRSYVNSNYSVIKFISYLILLQISNTKPCL